MKDLRTALLLSNNNAVLKSFVSQDLQPRMGVSNFIVVGQDVDNNPVHDFIVVVHDFIVGFTTLLYMDNCYEKYFVVAIRSIFVNDKHLATIENT